jgi:hypothetical protein
VSSTLRNDTRRAVFLADLAVAWDARPELTFGELLASALDSLMLQRLGEWPDSQVIDAVKRYVKGPG